MSLHDQFSWILPTCSTSAMAGARNPWVPICILHLKLGIFKFSYYSSMCHPGGMGSDFPKSQLPFSTLNWNGMITLWRILTNGDRRRDQQIPSLFQPWLTFLKHYSIESVQKYLAWPSMCTGHRRDKLYLFVAHHKAVATTVTHHSALAAYPLPPCFCFPWTCAFQ